MPVQLKTIGLSPLNPPILHVLTRRVVMLRQPMLVRCSSEPRPLLIRCSVLRKAALGVMMACRGSLAVWLLFDCPLMSALCWVNAVQSAMLLICLSMCVRKACRVIRNISRSGIWRLL